MKRIYINDALKLESGEVFLQGFVDNLRDSKKVSFIILKDITEKIQITIDKETNSKFIDTFSKLTQDSVISVLGTIKKDDYIKLHGMEIIPLEIKIESIAEALPIIRKSIPATKNKIGVERSNIDDRINYRWIDLRTDENQLLFKVQTLMVNSLREYLVNKDFIEIHTPKLISTASESGADLFKVKYFDRDAYLAQSPQFYKQMAMASGFDKIFEVGPVFRAEKSYTNRHTTEFTGFDIEISYINSFEDIMSLEESLLTYMLEKVNEKYGEEIEKAFNTKVVVPTLPFPRMSLGELYLELERRYGYKVNEDEKGDLTTEAEKLSFDLIKEKFNHEFLFVTDYNAKNRAFYHMRDEKGFSLGYDLIWRGTEITTGAQREHRYEILKKQADESGLSNDVKFYLEFFKYGCPPHGGFGIGVDRLTMLLLNLTIKDAMFLFRGPNRLNP